MKKLFAISLCILLAARCLGQNAATSKVANGNRTFYSISTHTSVPGLGMNVDSNTKWIEYSNTIPNQPQNNYVFLEGTKQIRLFLAIHRDSIAFYRYSIIQNNNRWLATNAVPDAAFIHGSFNNKVQIYLGAFDISAKILTVEIYKTAERNKVASITIYNKPIQPARIFQTIFHVTSKNGVSAVDMDNHKDGFKFKLQDSIKVTGILLCTFPSDLTFLYHVYIKNLSTGNTQYVSNNWNYGFFDVNNIHYPYLEVDAAFFSNPGNYEISIIPQLFSRGFKGKAFPDKATKIRFTVLRSAQMFSSKELLLWGTLGIAVIAVIAGLSIYLLKRNNARKLHAANQQKEQAQMQLGAVRAQLNPHFMFNALSGIQSLMNKNEPDQANRYLSRFARLTRSVLSNKDMNSVPEEKALLDDYLQMEQLRFGFTYTITADTQADLANIEIPAMLLQPLVENAVKHGVAQLGAEGSINIRFVKKSHDLIIFIKDNGRGFDVKETSSGLGLTLTHNRIALLNSIYKSSAILLDLQSEPANTTATVTLKQWCK